MLNRFIHPIITGRVASSTWLASLTSTAHDTYLCTSTIDCIPSFTEITLSHTQILGFTVPPSLPLRSEQLTGSWWTQQIPLLRDNKINTSTTSREKQRRRTTRARQGLCHSAHIIHRVCLRILRPCLSCSRQHHRVCTQRSRSRSRLHSLTRMPSPSDPV